MKHSFKRFFATACLIASTMTVNADTLFLGGFSRHPFSNHDYNESHNLVGYARNNWTAAYFKNSYGEDSFAAGYTFKKQFNDDWEGGLLVGASYGYRNCMKGWDSEGEKRRVCQVIAPSLTYTGFAENTGLKPSVIVLGSAFAITLGIDTTTLGKKFRQTLGQQ